MATRAVFQAHVDSLQAESLPFVWQWSLPAAVLKRETLGWGPGDQTLVPPSGTTIIVINPPVGTTATLKIGNSTVSTTGWEISHSVPTILTLGPLIVTRIIYASVVVTGIEVTYF